MQLSNEINQAVKSNELGRRTKENEHRKKVM